MNELKPAAKPRTASGRIQGRATLGNESEVKARDASHTECAFNRQRNQMEHLLSALQDLENRLSPVLMTLSPSVLKREEDLSCGSSPLIAEVEHTTKRLEEYTDKVNTLITMLEI